VSVSGFSTLRSTGFVCCAWAVKANRHVKRISAKQDRARAVTKFMMTERRNNLESTRDPRKLIMNSAFCEVDRTRIRRAVFANGKADANMRAQRATRSDALNQDVSVPRAIASGSRRVSTASDSE